MTDKRIQNTREYIHSFLNDKIFIRQITDDIQKILPIVIKSNYDCYSAAIMGIDICLCFAKDEKSITPSKTQLHLKMLEQHVGKPCIIVLEDIPSYNIKRLIDSDIDEMNKRMKLSKTRGLLYWLIFHQPYRNLYYSRIGKYSKLVSWYLRPYPLFSIGVREGIGENAFVLNHPYGTILNAKRIGKNFTVCQLTTIGNKAHGRNDLIPTIGDNVSIGANVNIIGDITIGNNVEIGAGSVVIEEVPPNCTVVGVPGRIVKRNNQKLVREDMNQIDLPDPISEDIRVLQHANSQMTNRILELEQALKQLKKEVDTSKSNV